MGQIQLTTSLVLIGLFSIAIIGFAISFANDNTVYVDISDDSDINTLNTKTGGNLSDYRGASDDSYSSLINSTIASGDETTISGGQFKITPVSALGVVTSVLVTGYAKIFGNESGFSVFITTFLALLLFIMAMVIWKTWAGRNPE